MLGHERLALRLFAGQACRLVMEGMIGDPGTQRTGIAREKEVKWIS